MEDTPARSSLKKSGKRKSVKKTPKIVIPGPILANEDVEMAVDRSPIKGRQSTGAAPEPEKEKQGLH